MRQLVVFDTEGVVVNGVWLIALFRRLGLIRFFRFALFSLLYKLRIRDFKQTIISVYAMARGVTKKAMEQAFLESRRIYGVRSAIDTLHQNGARVAITSSGVPDFIIKKLARQLHADVGIGLDLEFDGGIFTGKVTGDLLENDGKARVVRKLQRKFQSTKKETVSVSNDKNNLPMFKECGINIAFNPDLDMRKLGNYVCITQDLRQILPIVIPDYVVEEPPIELRSELKRKLVHLSGLVIIPMWILNSTFVIGLTLSITMLYAFSEVVRLDGYYVPVISEFTLALARPAEKAWFIVPPIWYAFGILVTLTFQPIPALIGLLALLVGDTCSALVGIKYGKHPLYYNRKKSIEGFLGFFSSTFIVILLFLGPIPSCIISLIAAYLETADLPINDNILVPVATAILTQFFILLL